MQGQLDAPLTERGIAQAVAAGRILRHQLDGGPPARLVISPLGRSRRSADLILDSLATLVDEIRIDDRLKEVSWGEFEGMTRNDVKANAPGFWRRRAADRWSVPPPGGESYAMLSERVRPVLDELLHLDKPVVVVAHGGVRRALRGLYGALPPAQVLALEEPHDMIVRLHGGTMATIPIR